MQKIIILLIVLPISLTSFAQKDINAWKNEKDIEQQYLTFKKNLNFWNGNYFLNEKQLTDYYQAFSDSVSILEKDISDKESTIRNLQNELSSTNNQLEKTKVDLETSIKNRNSIELVGINIDKGIYTLIISLIIVLLIVSLVILFFMYKRSNSVTAQTKKDFAELKEEFETHKKDSLERYTRINMELHHTRLQQKKK